MYEPRLCESMTVIQTINVIVLVELHLNYQSSIL